MSLSRHFADVVRFECTKCLRLMSPRAIERSAGKCTKCGRDTWTLITEYHERDDPDEYDRGLVSTFSIEALVEWMGWNRHNAFEGETIVLRTHDVPKEHVLGLVRAPFAKRGQLAFTYMEARRDDDAMNDREALRERGGQECLVCGVFYMPHADKPWTGAGYCTKACQASSGREAPVDFRAAETPKKSAAIAVTCQCGETFQVPAMYRGTPRACPACGVMTQV
jgi:hypothetical protein